MMDELRILITRHCATLAVEAEAVRQCLARFDDPNQNERDILAQGVELTHKITGSSGSIGFQEISAASRLLEQYFRSLMEIGQPLSQDQKDDARTHYADLERLVRSVSPESSSLYHMQLPAADGR